MIVITETNYSIILPGEIEIEDLVADRIYKHKAYFWQRMIRGTHSIYSKYYTFACDKYASIT